MLRVFHRERVTSEPNTFVARLDGPVLLVAVALRRNSVSEELALTLPCWVSDRDRVPPAYHETLFALKRHGAETWSIVDVPIGDLAGEPLWLMSVPETYGNAWWRAALPAPKNDRGRDDR